MVGREHPGGLVAALTRFARGSGVGENAVMTSPVTDLPEAGTVRMYTTSWCGYCMRLKAQLGRAGIPVAEIDIEADPSAAAIVESVNGGNQTVPTVVFPDGTVMTNPSIAAVEAHLGR